MFQQDARATLPSRQRFAAIDLFAGIGGLSMGFAEAGITAVAAVEHFAEHARAYRLNHPETSEIVVEDIEAIEPVELLRAANLSRGHLDFIIGGPPCQPFSMAGKRRGKRDQRGGAIGQFIRFVEILRPRCFVMENVPGLASIHNGKFLNEILSAFSDLRYRVEEPRVLNAAEFGVPQIRKRLFLLGTRDRRLKLRYPTPTHYNFASAVQASFLCEPFVTVDDAISDLPTVGEASDVTDESPLPYAQRYAS